MKTISVPIGKRLVIGGDAPILPQTMCNTHTSDIEGTLSQCIRMAEAGSALIRITVPGLQDVPHIAEIRRRFRAAGYDTPIVADIHFSSETAIAVAPHVEKVRINPGNFHPDHEQARAQFARLLAVCKDCGTAIRVGLNHGSLGKYITDLYGNTPLAMAKAAIANWTMFFAQYMAPAHVRVNAVAPGFMVNDRSRKYLCTPDGGLSARGEQVMAHTPARRFGEAEDLLGCVDWLLDDTKSAFVTGITVPVDGGFLASAGV